MIKLIKEAPKPLLIIFASIVSLEMLMLGLSFKVTSAIRRCISMSLMYATLTKDKVWGSVFAGLFFIGGVFSLILFAKISLLLGSVVFVIALGIAWYLVFSKSMKIFYASKNVETQQ